MLCIDGAEYIIQILKSDWFAGKPPRCRTYHLKSILLFFY